MAKRKSCIAGEFVIERAESETITVYKIYDNTLGGLREAAAAIGFEINEKSNTRNNGAQLIKFVNEKAGIDDKNHAVAGEFSIEKLPSGTISVYKTYANTPAVFARPLQPSASKSTRIRTRARTARSSLTLSTRRKASNPRK